MTGFLKNTTEGSELENSLVTASDGRRQRAVRAAGAGAAGDRLDDAALVCVGAGAGPRVHRVCVRPERGDCDGRAADRADDRGGRARDRAAL